MPVVIAPDIRLPDALSDIYMPVLPHDDYDQSFLANGDSWFSLGQAPSYNLLLGLRFSRSTLIVNCAHSGTAMRKMIKWRTHDEFESLLGPRSRVRWSGVLVSGGGDDLLLALHYLLRPFSECSDASADNIVQLIAVDRFHAFENYLRQNYADLIALRDAPGSPNRDVPVFAHTYANATSSLVEAALGDVSACSPQLSSAMREKGIPRELWLSLSQALQDKLAVILLDLNLPDLYVVDTRHVLTATNADAGGPDGDWENEAYPSRDGYNKLARKWNDLIESVLARK